MAPFLIKASTIALFPIYKTMNPNLCLWQFKFIKNVENLPFTEAQMSGVFPSDANTLTFAPF